MPSLWVAIETLARPMRLRPQLDRRPRNEISNRQLYVIASLRHNEISDILGALVSKVSTTMTIEPTLQFLSGEKFNRRTTTTDDDAWLDIYARGFWGEGQEDAFLM